MAAGREYSSISRYSPRGMSEKPNSAVTELAARRLMAALPHGTGRTGPDMSVTNDGRIHVTGPGERPIVAEAVERVTRSAVRDAWRQLSAYAEAADAVPVLVVPRVTKSLRELADDEGLNWVDFAGNARIDADPVLVWIEGRPDLPTPVARGTNPFVGRSLNLVRALLDEPGRAWRQKELVARSRLSQPRASKVLAALQELELVRREEDSTFRVVDPFDVVDAWADTYTYRRQEIVPLHVTGEGIGLARNLAARFDEEAVIHWFTGLPAAWAYDHFARFRLVSVFVSADPVLVAEHLGLRHAERGANVHLLAAGEQRLEIGHRVADGLRCVHPAQAYVDLLGLPERATEAAEHLRPTLFAEAQA